jgi:uncharacterized membrane protein
VKTTVRSAIVIHRPPEDIAQIFLDAEKAPLWNTGLERFEVLTAAPGLAGSRARLHFVQGGRRYVMEDELMEVEPGRRYRSQVSGDMLEAEIETVLAPTDSGTLVTVHWTGSGRGVVLRLLLPLMRRSLARQISVDLAKLKQLAEEGGA